MVIDKPYSFQLFSHFFYESIDTWQWFSTAIKSIMERNFWTEILHVKIWDFYLLLMQGVHQYCHVTGKNLMTGQEVRRNSVNAEIQQIVWIEHNISSPASWGCF